MELMITGYKLASGWWNYFFWHFCGIHLWFLAHTLIEYLHFLEISFSSVWLFWNINFVVVFWGQIRVLKWYFSYIFHYIDNIFIFPEWKRQISISITHKWTIFFRNTSPKNGKFLEWVKCSGLECCLIWYVFIGHK